MNIMLTFLGRESSVNSAIRHFISFLPEDEQNRLSTEIYNSIKKYTNLSYGKVSCMVSDLLNVKPVHISPLCTWKGVPLPNWLSSALRAAKISVQPLNAVVNRLVFLPAQVEDILHTSSYSCAQPIRVLTYGILLTPQRDRFPNLPQNSTLVEYDRGENGRNIEASFTLPDGSSVPSVNNMHLLSIPERKKIYNKGMGIEREPHSALSDLHFLLSVIAFWVRNTHPNLIHIYALWLSVLKLNVISPIANMKGGPGTSTKASPTGTSAAASGRYLTHGMLENMPSTSGAVGKGTGDLISLGALKKQCSKTPVDCERAAERMAVFETKERIFGHNSPDRTHLHAFAQFQAIYRAALDFNSVLNQPYHSNVASRVFQGKCLYNISVKLDKCTDPLNEILVMLGRDNRLANWFQKSIAYIQNWFRGKETILNPPHDREDDDTEDFDELVRSSDQKQGAYKLRPRKRQKLVPWNKEMSRNTFTN